MKKTKAAKTKKPQDIPACSTVGDLLCELRRLDPEMPIIVGMADAVKPVITKEVWLGPTGDKRSRFALMLDESDPDEQRDAAFED